MKKTIYLFTLFITLLLTACQQKPAANSTKTPANQELSDGAYCYEYRVGQDVTTVNLIVNGNNVGGEMNWLPYEKDGARGTLQGTRNGNEIKAIWSYIIEGSNQTEEVMFKIEGEQLMRKIGELEDPKYDGNLKLKDPGAAQYTEIYNKIACS